MIEKCIHVAKDPLIGVIRVTPKSTQQPFELCMECAYIWNNDKRPNPIQSEGYNVYRSMNPDLPKDQWTKVNEKPIPPTPKGKVL